MLNKFFWFALYLAVLVFVASSSSFIVFVVLCTVCFMILERGRRFIIAKRAFAGVFFFSALSMLGAAVSLLLLGQKIEFYHYAVLFLRSFTAAFMTLSIVDRVGIFNIFSSRNEFSIFIVLLLTKIESLKSEMSEFLEAARSRGLRLDKFSDSLSVLSVLITAMLLKSIDGFRVSAEALRSRGHCA